MKIKVLENGFTMEDAYHELMKKGHSKDLKIDQMDILFYPYNMVEYNIEYKYEKGKFKNLDSKVIILVDMMRQDVYAIAKSKGTFMEIEVDDNDKSVMPCKIDEEQAIKRAPSYIAGEIMTAKRVWRSPKLILQSKELIYKPFYIVQCKNELDEHYHIMYDAVSGHFSLLNA